MRIIISPHPDDELIACMSQLDGARVVQMFAFEYRLIEFINLMKEPMKIDFNVIEDLDEIVKLCENAKDVFIPSACDLNLEHKWVSNYILKKAQFKEGTSVYLYSYNYLFPTLNGKVLPTIAVPVDVERKKQLVEKYYPSQYPSLRDCGLLDGLKNFEEFAIWKRGI